MPNLRNDILLEFRHALSWSPAPSNAFDEVAALSVEGLNKSAIVRVKRITWNTVDRWLQKAADSCRRFKDQKVDGIAI
jgi:hypothetical protein